MQEFVRIRKKLYKRAKFLSCIQKICFWEECQNERCQVMYEGSNMIVKFNLNWKNSLLHPKQIHESHILGVYISALVVLVFLLSETNKHIFFCFNFLKNILLSETNNPRIGFSLIAFWDWTIFHQHFNTKEEKKSEKPSKAKIST